MGRQPAPARSQPRARAADHRLGRQRLLHRRSVRHVQENSLIGGSMLIRIDAARLTDAAGLHAALDEAFGFAPAYGRNLDALVDCLTYLEEPKAALSRVQVFPRTTRRLVI